MKYKVWLEVEAVDDDEEIYENVSSFPVCAGEFDSPEEADDFIENITGQRSDACKYEAE